MLVPHIAGSASKRDAGGVVGGEDLDDWDREGCWDEGGVESSTLVDRGGDGLFEEFWRDCMSVGGWRGEIRGGWAVLSIGGFVGRDGLPISRETLSVEPLCWGTGLCEDSPLDSRCDPRSEGIPSVAEATWDGVGCALVAAATFVVLRGSDSANLRFTVSVKALHFAAFIASRFSASIKVDRAVDSVALRFTASSEALRDADSIALCCTSSLKDLRFSASSQALRSSASLEALRFSASSQALRSSASLEALRSSASLEALRSTSSWKDLRRAIARYTCS